MIDNVNEIIFPEGESQEIPRELKINQLVDLNGNPLPLPPPTDRMIIYRVFRISRKTTRNEIIKQFHLELVRVDELTSWL